MLNLKKSLLYIGVGAPIVYCATGVGLVKGYHSLPYSLQENCPKSITKTVLFYEANYRVFRCFTTVAATVSEYMFYNLCYKQKFKGQKVSIQTKNEYFHPVYQRGAERALKTFVDLGGIFIKIGQELSMMDTLIPKEYVETMKPLQDKVLYI